MEILDVERFEEWSKNRGYLQNFDKEDCFPPVYKHTDTQYAWEVWVSAIDSTGALEMLEALSFAKRVIGEYSHEESVPVGRLLAVSGQIDTGIRKARGE